MSSLIDFLIDDDTYLDYYVTGIDHLSFMPFDVIVKIMSYLNMTEIGNFARCSSRFRHFIYEDSLWYHKSIESSYISSSVPIDSESHEEFYWRNFFIAEHTTETNWRLGIGLRQQLGGYSTTSLCNFVEQMIIYEGKVICIGQSESRASKKDFMISEPRCDVWSVSGLYLGKLSHPVTEPFPNSLRVFSGLDVNATEIITASGDTLRIFNNDDHYELRDSYDLKAPIQCFEKAKGNFYVALYKQSAIFVAGTSTVLEGHQEPVLAIKRLGNSGQLVSMTKTSSLVWNLNKNPAHCVGVIGQGLQNPEIVHFDFPSKTLLATYQDGSIAVWKTTTNYTSKSADTEIKLAHTLSKHAGPVSCMDVSGNVLVTACTKDRTILLWDIQTGYTIDSIVVKEATEFLSIKFCRGLIVCLLQRKAIVFDKMTRKKLCNLHIAWNGKIDCTAMALENDNLAIGCGYGAFLWDFRLAIAPANEKEHPVLKMHKLEIHLY